MNNLLRVSLLISACVLSFSLADAQITITRANVDSILAPGRSIPTITDNSLTNVDIGTEGSLINIWDFSMLAVSSFQVLHSVAAAGSPWIADFPGATNAFRVDTTFGSLSGSIFQYLQVTNTEVRNMGAKGRATGLPVDIRIFVTPSELVYHLPATVGTNWVTSFTNRTLVSLGGSTISDVSHTHNARYWVDAAGTMNLPGSTWPVFALRIRRIDFYDNSPVGGYIFLSKGGALVQVETYDTTTTTGTIPITRGKTLWNHSIVPDQEPVPVQMVSFTGSRTSATSVRLNWRTVSETNNYGFEVQRRETSLNDFETLPNSFIAGHGTTLEPHDYSFTDAAAPAGELQYRLKQIDLDGTIHYTEPVSITIITSVADNAPSEFKLFQNYPNPFNPTTNVGYALPQASYVTLKVYNLLGQEVAELVNGHREVGYYQETFDAGNLASGLYIYRLSADKFTSTRKLVVLR